MPTKKNPRRNDGSSIFSLIEKGLDILIERIFGRGVRFDVFEKGKIQELWLGIESLEPRLSVIEGDKLVDTVLKKAGIKGESMGDRMRNCQRLANKRSYSDMWEAHKIRNMIVHEHDFVIDELKGHQAIQKMKRFLIELGAFK